MPRANVLRWRDGAGWLVLSGGGAVAGDVEAQALALVSPGEPLAYIWAAGDVESADQHLDALLDLGAPTGYLVDVLTEDDDTIRNQISNAGLIIIGDGPNAKQLRSGLLGAAVEGMVTAFDRGAVILGIGQGAAILGSFMTDQAGIGWVEGAAIAPHYNRDEVAKQLHDLLLNHPEAYGLGIATGSALALGPKSEVEAWGERQVTVKLGGKFRI
ncbi:MAG: hypothetical protein IT324_15910 [Anaerolineae bacterium]|nr:hypothetical protein [Anaerolineae bacterium]